MKRENRLTHNTDFERVRRCGKSYAHPLVLLQVAKREDDDLKIGIVVSRAIGSAVKRNRTKRRLRACISEMLPSIGTGWDLVLIPRRPITLTCFEEIRRVCSDLLTRAKVTNFQRQ